LKELRKADDFSAERRCGGEAVQYHHPDRLGTRLVTTPANGSYFEQQTLPFGTALNESPPTGAITGETNRRFTSYDRSTTTKLDYAVNRHYDPQQGRFTQVDPAEMEATSLENPQTLNLYAYCTNDPINHTDPSGLGFFSFLKKIFKWIAVALTVVVAVLTIIYAPYLFATTLKLVFGVISAVASAASSVLSAFGLTKAAGIFGIIAAAASLGTSLLASIEKTNWKTLLKAVSDGATLTSRTLSAYGHKMIAQVFDLAGSVTGFISGGLKRNEITDPLTGKVIGYKYSWAASDWETYKFIRGTTEKVANLAGATRLGGYLNVLGLVDDAYDFYLGIKNRGDDEKTPDTVEKLNVRKNTRRALSGFEEVFARSIIVIRNRLTRSRQEAGRINSSIGRVEKGIALAH
jgi:RHS repeat-associated protein